MLSSRPSRCQNLTDDSRRWALIVVDDRQGFDDPARGARTSPA
jgi:hypothetical protein